MRRNILTRKINSTIDINDSTKKEKDMGKHEINGIEQELLKINKTLGEGFDDVSNVENQLRRLNDILEVGLDIRRPPYLIVWLYRQARRGIKMKVWRTINKFQNWRKK
tara:strand:+ start:22 stop:345 length:324 start_codon:yes stop_codon:yes gene_type:complete